jgi:hypothetical protein
MSMNGSFIEIRSAGSLWLGSHYSFLLSGGKAVLFPTER